MSDKNDDLFIVSRASWSSTGDRAVQPCDGAFLKDVVDVDIRTVDDPNLLKGITSKDWHSLGENHRIINGNIARDVGYTKEWAVKLPNMVDLVEFLTKYGECILSVDAVNRITIYDDYIE